VEYLNYSELVILVRAIKDPQLMKRVTSLERYEKKDITGLQAHLNILIHSELGQFFEKNANTFTLDSAINQQAVVYFALPALRFPSFSKVLGKLVINDLKAVIDRNIHKKVFTVFDEFSVFAGEQVLNLVNMGRGKGVHAIFGTQGLADLDKIDTTFKSQVLNCVNTIICHRLNDQESAEPIANWIGTKDAFTVTAQLNMKQGDAGMGTVKRNKEFIVHPDAIKQNLSTGEVFYVTKVGKFKKDKVKIKFV
jgi:type IV secretory pathway TraG/TraD family ATPase VirD4